jgi:hypothetical protein
MGATRPEHIQGFTKEIRLDTSKWKGAIKDYDGGTMMHCVIHPKINYMDIYGMIKLQVPSSDLSPVPINRKRERERERDLCVYALILYLSLSRYCLDTYPSVSIVHLYYVHFFMNASL